MKSAHRRNQPIRDLRVMKVTLDRMIQRTEEMFAQGLLNAQDSDYLRCTLAMGYGIVIELLEDRALGETGINNPEWADSE